MKNIIKSIKNFFKGVYSELQKVSWPSRNTVINHTIVVIVSAVIVTAITAAIDYGLSKSLQYFLTLKS